MTERWRSGIALLVSVLVLAAVVLAGPGDELDALRRVIGLGPGPLGEPADAPPGGVYSFLQEQPGDSEEPVTWDPCRVIRYEVNPDGAPAGAERAEDLVADAVAEVSVLSGLQFEYLGRTDRRPSWRADFVPAGRREPVLVAWATESEVEELEGDVAGVGGAVAVPYPAGRRLRFVTGQVTLDEAVYDELERDGDDVQQRAILLHEVGHLVGLGHVDSPAELMFGENVGLPEFGPGDRNGLARLGTGRCA